MLLITGMIHGLRRMKKWYIALLVISIVCYIATYAFSGILFMWFNPSGHDCGLNVFFIVVPMILALIFAIIALHPAVNGSLLPASVISVYCAYVCYTDLSSKPRDYVCNGLNKSKAVDASTLIFGMPLPFSLFYILNSELARPPHSFHQVGRKHC